MWDMHRHRLPPQLIQRIDELRKHAAAARFMPASMLRFAPRDERIEVTWRPRGTQTRAHGSRSIAS